MLYRGECDYCVSYGRDLAQELPLIFGVKSLIPIIYQFVSFCYKLLYLYFNRKLRMQSSPPPNLANLNQLFVQYDADQDGRVNDQQIENIFNQAGFTDVYMGTIRKVIRLLNSSDQSNKTLDFIQLQQYAEAMVTKGKFKVWKAKLSYQLNLKQKLDDIYAQEDQQNGASPGASPGGAPQQKNPKQVDQQQGQISINIGNAAECDQYLNFSLQKQKGQQIKPFLKLSLERKTNAQAVKVETLFNKIYETVIQILKADEEELISQILSVSFITSVNENTFNLFITTGNQGLIELVQIIADSLDIIMKHPANGKIHGLYRFNFDFSKFISDPSYNFYDLLVKNSSIFLKWNAWGFFSNLRKLVLKTGVLSQLKYDITDPFCFFIIMLLHCQKFTGKLQFESTSTEVQQVESKDSIKEFFSSLRSQMTEMDESCNLGLIQLIGQLDGRLKIEAGVRDWRVNIESKIPEITKLLTEEIGNNQKETSATLFLGKQKQGDTEMFAKAKIELKQSSFDSYYQKSQSINNSDGSYNSD